MVVTKLSTVQGSEKWGVMCSEVKEGDENESEMKWSGVKGSDDLG